MNKQQIAPEILNQATIATLLGICEEVNPDFLDELIEMFVAVAPGLIEKIKAAAAGGDSKLLEATAHRLKGSSLNLGGSHMAEICDSLEKKGREQELTGVDDLTERLDKSYLELLSELDKLTKQQRVGATQTGGLKPQPAG